MKLTQVLTFVAALALTGCSWHLNKAGAADLSAGGPREVASRPGGEGGGGPTESARAERPPPPEPAAKASGGGGCH
jgi:hypothetical protein